MSSHQLQYGVRFSRCNWMDDERNVSQIFTWDCNDKHDAELKEAEDKYFEYYMGIGMWKQVVSKNYEFESRFRKNNMNNGVSDEYLKQISKKTDHLKPVSQLGDELALSFERLTRPKVDIFEEFEEF